MSPTRKSFPTAAALLGLLALACFLAPQAVHAAASPWAENPESRVRLITPYEVAPRNGNLVLGLHYTLTPGWHVYWKNSGDAGFPPVLVFDKASGLGEGGDAEILWPAPHRFELPGDLVAFGYEDEVVYPVRTTIQATGDQIEISGALDYLVCEVDCIPYRYDLKLTQKIGDVGAMEVPDLRTAPLIEKALNSLPVPPERLAGVETSGRLIPGSSPALEVRLRGAQGKPGEVDLFLESHDQFGTGKPEIREEDGGLVFRVPLQALEAGKPMPESTSFAWTVTGLRHDSKPVSVESRQTVTAGPPAASGPADRPLPASLSLRLLFLAFAGGLVLNLMPSVLALLVPSLLELRHSASASPAAARSGAAIATGGVLAASWAAAALFASAATSGIAGWGTQLQDPAVATLLTLAAAWLALNLWGLVPAPLAGSGHRVRLSKGRAALIGVLTPVLAGAWILPLLTDPVGVAAARGGASAFAVFTALGLGLALPYLLVAAAPRLLRALPGFASERLREALGFAAAAGTFWLLYALSRQVSAEGLAWIELALLAMALFAWLRQRSAATRAALRVVLTAGLLASAALALWLADRNRLAPAEPAAQTVSIESINPSEGGI